MRHLNRVHERKKCQTKKKPLTKKIQIQLNLIFQPRNHLIGNKKGNFNIYRPLVYTGTYIKPVSFKV